MHATRLIYSLLTRSERRDVWVLLGLMIVAAVLETFGVSLVVPAIAILLQEDPAGGYFGLGPLTIVADALTRHQLVAWGMALFASAYVIKAAFLMFVIWRQNIFAYDLHARLSQRLFQVYLRQPYTFHLQRNSAQLIRNAVSEVSQVAFGGIAPAVLLVTESLVICGIGILLLAVQPVGAMIVAAALGSAAWLFRTITSGPVAAWAEGRPYHEGMRIQYLQEGLGGVKEVKLLGREADFLKHHRDHAVASARVGRVFHTLLEFPRLGLELLGVLGLVALVLTMLVQGREATELVVTVSLFAAAAFRLMPSVNRVVNSAQGLRAVVPAIETLHADLTLPAPDASGALESMPFTIDIRLKGVTYTYPGGSRPALEDVFVSIARQEMVGFVGPSGSGKSTLVDVLLGLLTPDTGQIQLDGRNIQSNLRGWQNLVGYVPQSIYLTDDTLRRNVAFGLSEQDIDDAAVRRAVSAAQLEEFVSTLPQGLETRVGERGVRLSGGERQRIAIARALYHDPAVLVLDEATSALDVATERRVMQAVTALRSNKTIIVVAHRLSTVEPCDRLYRLEHGRVTAEGASAEVLGSSVGPR